MADQAIRFDELCTLLGRLGFTERRHGGSHRIFSRSGVAEILNLQPRPDGTAKPYQVRQVRAIILKYGLAADAEGDTDDA
jgi:predicted RNA binding protein YcfA (HicA-like mRNA interferase family)